MMMELTLRKKHKMTTTYCTTGLNAAFGYLESRAHSLRMLEDGMCVSQHFFIWRDG